MQPKVNITKNNETITINYKGKTRFLKVGSSEFDKVQELRKDPNEETRETNLVEFFEALVNRTVGRPTTEGRDFIIDEKTGEVSIRNSVGNFEVVPKGLGNRVKEFAAEGLPYGPLLNCARDLLENVSYIVRNRLYEWLEINKHPILPDGRFLAWKKVRRNEEGNLVDIRTGTFDNNVGQVVEMDRKLVCDDDDQTCMSGLHLSAYDYAKNHYGSLNDIMVEVAVVASDIVSIPKDYNAQKIRTCRYEVLNICEEENKENLVKYNNGFRSNVDANNSCEECGEIIDFCECETEDDEVEYCPECGDELNDSGDCDWCEDTCPDCCESFDDCSCIDEDSD